jgi:hypothetical protein
MNKMWAQRFCSVFLLVVFAGISSVSAAATQFTSPNFKMESLIFGGTGILRSSEASVPPRITSGPTVSAIQTTSADVKWTTDKPGNSVVLFGTERGKYVRQSGQLTDTSIINHDVVLDGLIKGTTYYYKVQTSDVAGNLAVSSENTFSTDPGDVVAPSLKSGPIASFTSATSVTVTWETDEISTSQVEYGALAVNENTVGSVDELTLFHQVQLNNLKANQDYFYRVRSKDTSGNTLIGQTLNMRTPTAPSVTSVSITDITLNSAIVQWQTTTLSSSVVQYGNQEGVYSDSVADASFNTAHTIRLTGLQSGTTYSLQIVSTDSSGNHFTSDVYKFKTIILPVISNLVASNIGSSTATLTWDSSSDIDELVHYAISKSPDDPTLFGKEQTTGSANLVSIHSIGLTNLESGVTYTVSVMGKDSFGNAALSSILTFDSLPDHDPPKILNLKSDTTVDLGGKNVNVLVAFGLSELAKAHIEYGSGASGGYEKTVDTDTEYSTTKLLVVPNLTPGQSYHFKVVAFDRKGNRTDSPDYLVLAPTQPVSLLDLIFGQIRDNFGWLSH